MRIPAGLTLAALILATGGAGWLSADRRPTDREVLGRAGEYVAACFERLPRLVATETTTQRSRPRQPDAEPVTRRLVAEFAWIPLADEYRVMGFRDVVEVDGLPVAGRERRLQALLHGDGATWADARATMERSARFNLVPGSRNFNLPTAAAHFLLPDMQARFSWKRRSTREAAVWDFAFREKGRRTIVRTGKGAPVPSRGLVRIDAASGAIVRTELEVELDDEKIAYWLAVDFAPVERLGLTLPVTLSERYDSPDETVIGRATYANYRQFETRARIVGD